MKEQVMNLSKETGCSISLCTEAIKYANDKGYGNDMAVAYLKAKTLAVKTHCSFDERVMRFMNNSNQIENSK